jgi:hypothetical protein
VIVVLNQSADDHHLPEALQLAFEIAVFAAGARFQGQGNVGPQLAFGAEAIWGLDQCHQQRRSNRSHVGNLSQSGRSVVPPCCTMNSRPLPSFGCCRSRGALSPLTTVESATLADAAGPDEAGGGLPPPQPASKAAARSGIRIYFDPPTFMKRLRDEVFIQESTVWLDALLPRA